MADKSLPHPALIEKPHTALGVGSWLVCMACGVLLWSALFAWWLA